MRNGIIILCLFFSGIACVSIADSNILIKRLYLDVKSEHQDLHIVYADGSDVVAPKLDPGYVHKKVGDLFDPNQVRFMSAKIADDNETVGWVATFNGCCQSYDVGRAVVVYKDGKIIATVTDVGAEIYNWNFINHGKQVRISSGAAHGCPFGTYGLFDAATGRQLEDYGWTAFSRDVKGEDGEGTCLQDYNPEKDIRAPKWVQSFSSS